MTITLTTTECEAFIGRELLEREAQDFDLFREVAELRLNNLLSRDVSEIDAPADFDPDKTVDCADDSRNP